jgi:predicted enzyme related to lactoylglutathione lyase
MSSENRPARITGMIAHTEIASTSPSETREFLSKVFGWEFQNVNRPDDLEMYSYRTAVGVQGTVRKTASREPPSSLNYVLVDDIGKAEEKVRASGGEIVLPRVDVPKMGSFFWFKVPGGPILACWQDAPRE